MVFNGQIIFMDQATTKMIQLNLISLTADLEKLETSVPKLQETRHSFFKKNYKKM